MKLFCPQCGGELLKGDAFCTSCGSPRPQDPIVAAAPDVGAPASAVVVPVDASIAAPHPPRSDPTGVSPAPLRVRAMSWAIDGAIILVTFALASAIHELLGVVVLVVGTVAYYVLMLKGQWGGTVGHHVVGLAVVDDESREPIDPRTAGLRLAINAVLAIPFGLGLLLNIPMLDRSSGRTVHDVGSGAIVVRTR